VNTSVLVGCDAVDAGPDWVRLREPGGSLKTIAWGAIQMAATPVNDEHMTFEGDLGQVTTLRATHDPLWIETGEVVVIAMIEKDSPKHDSIVDTFKQRLGARWTDEITMQDAAMRLFKMPDLTRSRGSRKVLFMMMAAMFLIFLALFMLAVVHRAR
jgi:hypothetical protein